MTTTYTVARTLTPTQGLQIAFDSAALSTWPDAFLPAGLPAATKTTPTIELTVTATRPLTIDESFGVQVADIAGTTERSGSWSGPSGATDFQPGIDYWRLDNFDTSTGIYGWEAPYGTGSGSQRLILGNESDHDPGSDPFDITFRIERGDWLAQGDAVYERTIGRLWAGTGTSTSWSIVMTPRPADEASNFLTFSVAGKGSVSVAQDDAGFTDGVPVWVRCSRDGTALEIEVSPDGTSWTSVATDTATSGAVTSYTHLDAGGVINTFYDSRSNVDGILSEWVYRIGGDIVADIGLAGATHVTDTSWTAPSTGLTVTRSGGTLLGGAVGTVSPLFTASTAMALSDVVVLIPAILSGEVTVDSVALVLPSGQRIGLGWMVA